jgi:hypothetical protein
LQQEMTMIWHDHKVMEEKWMKVLNFIQHFNRLPREDRVAKNFPSIMDIGCDEHQFRTLNGMSLEHGDILKDRRQNACSGTGKRRRPSKEDLW